jgi:hypothetical protein
VRHTTVAQQSTSTHDVVSNYMPNSEVGIQFDFYSPQVGVGRVGVCAVLHCLNGLRGAQRIRTAYHLTISPTPTDGYLWRKRRNKVKPVSSCTHKPNPKVQRRRTAKSPLLQPKARSAKLSLSPTPSLFHSGKATPLSRRYVISNTRAR